jgi:hypothetical protein
LNGSQIFRRFNLKGISGKGMAEPGSLEFDKRPDLEIPNIFNFYKWHITARFREYSRKVNKGKPASFLSTLENPFNDKDKSFPAFSVLFPFWLREFDCPLGVRLLHLTE